MDQMQKEAFAAAGVDIDSALERCLGNETLLCRFYAKFLEDPNYAKLQTALAARDPAGLFRQPTRSKEYAAICR